MVASSTAVPSLSVTRPVHRCLRQTSGAIWPRSGALQYAEVRVVAPPDIGSHHWTLEFAARAKGSRISGCAEHPRRTVAAPDHESPLRSSIGESGAPLEGVNLIMHPTGRPRPECLARMKVAADHYELHASGLQRLPYRDHLDATKPVELRILMAVEQQSSHWTIQDKPQELSSHRC